MVMRRGSGLRVEDVMCEVSVVHIEAGVTSEFAGYVGGRFRLEFAMLCWL